MNTNNKLKAMRGAVKAIQRDMGIADDVWPMFLMEITGKTTSTKLTFAECKQVFSAANQMGWISPYEKAKKQCNAITFLWLRLRDAGKLNSESRGAFRTFCSKFTEGKEIAKATTAQRSACIEALKDWCFREGVSTGNIR